jgi:hypothetical protein
MRTAALARHVSIWIQTWRRWRYTEKACGQRDTGCDRNRACGDNEPDGRYFPTGSLRSLLTRKLREVRSHLKNLSGRRST